MPTAPTRRGCGGGFDGVRSGTREMEFEADQVFTATLIGRFKRGGSNALRASQALTVPQELFVVGMVGLNPHSDPSSTSFDKSSRFVSRVSVTRHGSPVSNAAYHGQYELPIGT